METSNIEFLRRIEEHRARGKRIIPAPAETPAIRNGRTLIDFFPRQEAET